MKTNPFDIIKQTVETAAELGVFKLCALACKQNMYEYDRALSSGLKPDPQNKETTTEGNKV